MGAQQFHGRCYWYDTAEGRRPIGVAQGLGNIWIVAYIRNTGARRRIRGRHLDPHQDPNRLQSLLDVWAYERNLDEVKE